MAVGALRARVVAAVVARAGFAVFNGRGAVCGAVIGREAAAQGCCEQGGAAG